MRLQAGAMLREALGRIIPAETLAVVELEIFFGPNPYSDQPVVLCTLEVGRDLPNAADLSGRVRKLLAGRSTARQAEATGAAAGAPENVGELAGSIAADLSAAGLGLPFGSGSRHSAAAGRTNFWVDCLIERVGIHAVRAAVTAVAAAIVGSAEAEARLRKEVARFDQICARRKPNNESRLLITAARRKNVPFLPLSDYPSLWQFGWGARSEHFWVTSSNGDGLVGGYLSKFKDFHKRLIRSLGLPTPDWRLLVRGADPTEAANAIGFPCVVKPADQGAGRGVTADIRDMRILREAIRTAGRYSETLLVEKHEPGDDHRLMVADGRLVMAIRRRPATAEGDGKRSVRELVAMMNEERHREAQQGGYLKPVPVDYGLETALAGQGLTLDSVPKKGETVHLRTNANHTTGGTVDEVIDDVHPEIRGYAEQLASAAGFRLLGIDYVTPDIGKSHEEAGGAFIEINATPGLEVFGNAVPTKIADLVLGTKPGRIPVCLVLADRDACQEIGFALNLRRVESAGIVTTQWARLGPLRLPDVDLRPAERAWSLLRYPTVTSLVVLWTIDELATAGMPVDAVDETIVAGAPPDGEWKSVVERCSGKVVSPLSPTETVEHVLRWLEQPNGGPHGDQRTDGKTAAE